MFHFPFNYHRQSLKGHWDSSDGNILIARTAINNFDEASAISFKEQIAQIPHSALTISWEEERERQGREKRENKKLTVQRLKTSSNCSNVATLPNCGFEFRKNRAPKTHMEA